MAATSLPAEPHAIRRRLPRLPILVALAYGLLIAAWAGGNPPYAAPDEPFHYLRAIEIARGDLIGEPARAPVGEPPPGVPEDIHRRQVDWLSQSTRVVHAPAGLAPISWLSCHPLDPTESAACLGEVSQPEGPTTHVTYVGTYHPAPYVLPSFAMLPARSELAAVRLGRWAAALSCFALVVLAIALLAGERRSLSLVGLFLALTPMSLFLLASLNPNGFEIAAAAAFIAALLRLSRDATPPTWVWAALGASGVALALSRTPGPTWIVMSLVLFVALGGRRGVFELLRAHRRAALVSGGLVLVAMLANLAWEREHGPRATVSISPIGQTLSAGIDLIPSVVEQEIGAFSSLEVRLPLFAYAIWYGALVALLLLAAWVGQTRERLVLAGALVLSLAVPVVFWALIFRHTFYGLQGRYFLPIAIAVPLFAGEVLFRNRERLTEVVLAAFVVTAAGVASALNLLAWYINARRWGVGVDGPRWIVGAVEWSPAGTWWPWSIAAVGGALLLFAGVAVSTIRPFVAGLRT